GFLTKVRQDMNQSTLETSAHDGGMKPDGRDPPVLKATGSLDGPGGLQEFDGASELGIVEAGEAEPEGVHLAILFQAKLAAMCQQETRALRGGGPGRGVDRRMNFHPESQSPCGTIEGDGVAEPCSEFIRQMVAALFVDLSRLAGVTAEIAFVDQLGESGFQEDIALTINRFAQIFHSFQQGGGSGGVAYPQGRSEQF